MADARRYVIAGTALALSGVAVLAGWRFLSARRPNDPRTVVIATEWSGATAEEVEQDITIPVERALAGIPGVTGTKSASRRDVSTVWAMLAPGADEWHARQDALERLRPVDLPRGARLPAILPASTSASLGLGISAPADADPTLARSFADVAVQRAVASVPGVASVTFCGGRHKQLWVSLDPAALRARGVSVLDVVHALEARDLPASRSFVVGAGLGTLASPEAIVATAVGGPDGPLVRVKDVATVQVQAIAPSCTATREGKDDFVLGQVRMVPGADARTVAAAVRVRVTDASFPRPVGVEVLPLETEPGSRWIHARVHAPGGTAPALVQAAHGPPDVRLVITQQEDAESAELDLLVGLRPTGSLDDVARALARAFETIPGARYDLTSPSGNLPSELRGARVRLRGPLLETLHAVALSVSRTLAEVPGVVVASVSEAERHALTWSVVPDLEACAQNGVAPQQLTETLTVARHGRRVGVLRDGAEAVDVVVIVKGADAPGERPPDVLAQLDLERRGGGRVPVLRVVKVVATQEPRRLDHEDGERTVDVLFNARDEQALKAARARLAADVELPIGTLLTLAREGDLPF